MNQTNSTTTAQAPAILVKPLSVIYEVAKSGEKTQVTLTLTERGDVIYKCKCNQFALFGECPHSQAVQVERRKQGRK